jgi:hypothetical protein
LIINNIYLLNINNIKIIILIYKYLLKN